MVSNDRLVFIIKTTTRTTKTIDIPVLTQASISLIFFLTQQPDPTNQFIRDQYKKTCNICLTSKEEYHLICKSIIMQITPIKIFKAIFHSSSVLTMDTNSPLQHNITSVLLIIHKFSPLFHKDPLCSALNSSIEYTRKKRSGCHNPQPLSR